jgi:hypothetical protein
LSSSYASKILDIHPSEQENPDGSLKFKQKTLQPETQVSSLRGWPRRGNQYLAKVPWLVGIAGDEPQ